MSALTRYWLVLSFPPVLLGCGSDAVAVGAEDCAFCYFCLDTLQTPHYEARYFKRLGMFVVEIESKNVRFATVLARVHG